MLALRVISIEPCPKCRRCAVLVMMCKLIVNNFKLNPLIQLKIICDDDMFDVTRIVVVNNIAYIDNFYAAIDNTANRRLAVT